MSKKFLFCDLDDTLISIKSMFSFHDYWFTHWLAPVGTEAQREYKDINAIMRFLKQSGVTRKELNRRYYEFFAGRRAADVSACAEQWFMHVTQHTPDLWLQKSCSEMNRLRALGYEPVLVSGSLTEILQPIARTLGITHILATKLMRSGECYNGRIIAPQTIGSGKASAITLFLEQQQALAQNCAAMGDDSSDIPMLELVGHPIAVVGDPVLGAEAGQRGWRRIALDSICAVT